MDLREKITKALREAFPVTHVKLNDDEGISGFVVSDSFYGISALDRQKILDRVLRNSPLKFTKAEIRRILAIAPLTPVEYESLGVAI